MSRSNSGGIAVTGWLQVVFIVLKLLKLVNWSWWWVLAPTWITASIYLVLIIITILIYIFRR